MTFTWENQPRMTVTKHPSVIQKKKIKGIEITISRNFDKYLMPKLSGVTHSRLSQKKQWVEDFIFSHTNFQKQLLAT